MHAWITAGPLVLRWTLTRCYFHGLLPDSLLGYDLLKEELQFQFLVTTLGDDYYL